MKLIAKLTLTVLLRFCKILYVQCLLWIQSTQFLLILSAEEEFDELCFQYGLELDDVIEEEKQKPDGVCII
jgi:hypothetical protein